MKWFYLDHDIANIRGNLRYNVLDTRKLLDNLGLNTDATKEDLHKGINKLVSKTIDSIIEKENINEDNYIDIDIDEILKDEVTRNCSKIGLSIDFLEVTHYIFYDSMDIEIQ